MQDTVIEFPDLWLDVYIAGDKSEERAFAPMFVRSACKKADTPDEADLVVFTGGPDVNPALYGEKDIHSQTHFSDNRDRSDIHLWEHCVKNGIPMFGVCRGAQFGHVMKGGKLFQHVSSHYHDHDMWDLKKHVSIGKVSSSHHQMVMRDGPGMVVLGDSYASQMTPKFINSRQSISGGMSDVEAFFYRDVCFFGVQGHPEYKGYTRFAKWTLDCINEFVLENPDIELNVDNVRRIKKDLRVNSEASKVLKELA
jgi:gamma-glutamyl-gamma-aminobutyrate hydrolase PuuD